MLVEVKKENIWNEFKEGDSFVVEEIDTGVINVHDNYYEVDCGRIRYRLWDGDHAYVDLDTTKAKNQELEKSIDALEQIVALTFMGKIALLKDLFHTQKLLAERNSELGELRVKYYKEIEKRVNNIGDL